MPSEVRVVWSTPGGGTGFSVFHFLTAASSGDAQTQADQIQDFYDAIKGIFPNEVTFSWENEVRVLSNAGALVAVYPITPPANVIGANSASYNRAAGLRVDWATGVIVGGRRLNGRTYMVPTAADVFDSNGLVTSGNVTAVTVNAQALITASQGAVPLVIWSRVNGVSEEVQTASVPTQGAILRGRRD